METQTYREFYRHQGHHHDPLLMVTNEKQLNALKKLSKTTVAVDIDAIANIFHHSLPTNEPSQRWNKARYVAEKILNTPTNDMIMNSCLEKTNRQMTMNDFNQMTTFKLQNDLLIPHHETAKLMQQAITDLRLNPHRLDLMQIGKLERQVAHQLEIPYHVFKDYCERENVFR